MIILYAFAQKMNYLVMGTGDKSELMLGYFTKYGDGEVDVLPIGDLYKTQVRMLGNYLGHHYLK
jgi:NAD+ synthetase